MPATLHPTATDAEARKWGMLLHLSLLAGFLLPAAGWIVPIVIWQTKKHEVHGLDAHGRAAANWLASYLCYLIISGIMVIFLVGIPMLWALGIVGVVFPVVAAIKAGDGVVWRYPLSVPFFG